MNPCFQPSPFALVCATVTARDLVCATVSDSQVNFTDSACLCCCVWQPGELYWFRLSVLLCLTARWTLLIPPVCATVSDSQVLLSAQLCLTARALVCATVTARAFVCATVSNSQVNFTDSACLCYCAWQLDALVCATLTARAPVCATVSLCYCVWQPGALVCATMTARAPVCATVSDNQVLLSVLLCLTARALVCVTVSNSQVTTDSTCLCYCV